MLDLAKGRSQLSVCLCAINVVLAVTFARLSREARSIVSALPACSL
jgi:hypothetical protein